MQFVTDDNWGAHLKLSDWLIAIQEVRDSILMFFFLRNLWFMDVDPHLFLSRNVKVILFTFIHLNEFGMWDYIQNNIASIKNNFVNILVTKWFLMPLAFCNKIQNSGKIHWRLTTLPLDYIGAQRHCCLTDPICNKHATIHYTTLYIGRTLYVDT